MAIKHEDYLLAALKLLPQGRAWQRSLDGNLAKMLAVHCEELARVNATAHQLMDERFPVRAKLLLEDWEGYFGLPECGRKIEGKNLEQRQQQVQEKEDEVGSNSKLFLEEVAKRAGFNIKLVNIFPHNCLRDCLYPLYDINNAFRIFVYAPPKSSILTTLKYDEDFTREKIKAQIEAEPNSELACLLKRYAYAHLELVFIYDKDTE